MEDKESKKSEVEVDGLGLIDVAIEDDSLLFSEFSGELQYLCLFSFNFGFMGSGYFC